MTQTRETAAPTTTASRLYRAAGWAAIVAAIGYLTQPIIVFIIDPSASAAFDPDDPSAWYPDPADALSTWYLGSEQFLQFAAVAIGMLVLVLATGTLIRSRLGETGEFGVWPQLTQVAGLISVVGWFLVAGASLASHSLPAFSLTDFTEAGLQAQKIGLQAAGIASIGVLMGVMLLPTAIWLAGIATTGRRAGIVPAPVAVLCGITGLVFVANLLFLNLTNHVPQSGLLLIPVWLMLGILFLIRARRAKTTTL